MNPRILTLAIAAAVGGACARPPAPEAVNPVPLPNADLISWIERDPLGDLTVLAREPAYFVALKRTPEGHVALITPTAESGDSSARAWASSYAEFQVGFRPAPPGAYAPPRGTGPARGTYEYVSRTRTGPDGKPMTVFELVERMPGRGRSDPFPSGSSAFLSRGFVVVFASTSPFAPEAIAAARAAIRKSNPARAEQLVAAQLFGQSEARWQASRVEY